LTCGTSILGIYFNRKKTFYGQRDHEKAGGVAKVVEYLPKKNIIGGHV
jgi:hypothetical protein